VTGDKVSKDGKRTQASGRVGETVSKDKTATAAAGKPADVRKSHEVDGFKSDVRSDAAVPDQGDADDRQTLIISYHIILYHIDFLWRHSASAQWHLTI